MGRCVRIMTMVHLIQENVDSSPLHHSLASFVRSASLLVDVFSIDVRASNAVLDLHDDYAFQQRSLEQHESFVLVLVVGFFDKDCWRSIAKEMLDSLLALAVGPFYFVYGESKKEVKEKGCAKNRSLFMFILE